MFPDEAIGGDKMKNKENVKRRGNKGGLYCETRISHKTYFAQSIGNSSLLQNFLSYLGNCSKASRLTNVALKVPHPQVNVIDSLSQ